MQSIDNDLSLSFETGDLDVFSFLQTLSVDESSLLERSKALLDGDFDAELGFLGNVGTKETGLTSFENVPVSELKRL